MSVQYVRTAKQGVPDYASAVVDVVSYSATPTGTGAKPASLSGWGLKHGFDFCTWKKRFLRLDASTLRYYKGPKASSPKGVIQLSAFCLCRPCEIGDERPANAVSYVKMVHGSRQVQKVQRANGLYISVPEHERTYGLHFTTVEDRNMWVEAISTNIELLRQQPGMIEEMIEKVVALADTGSVPREKVGIIKMALRGRFNPLIDIASNDPFTKALIAVAMADLGGVQSALQPEHVHQKTVTGSTLLIKACTVGNVDITRYLLSQGADANVAKEDDGDTPLIVAARLNHIKVVRLLLEHGAIRYATNTHGETAASEGRHKNGQVTTMLETYVPAPEASADAGPTLLPGVASLTSVSGVPRTSTMSQLSPEQLKQFIEDQQSTLRAAQDALAVAQQQSDASSNRQSVISTGLPPDAADSLQSLSTSLKREPCVDPTATPTATAPGDLDSDSEDEDEDGARDDRAGGPAPSELEFEAINLTSEAAAEGVQAAVESLDTDRIELTQ